MSSLLNKSLNNETITAPKTKYDDDTITENPNSKDSDNNINNNESYEIPPERDLRDTQPTISVNYRIIKDNEENELNDRKQRSQKAKYQDDWNNNDSEW